MTPTALFQLLIGGMLLYTNTAFGQELTVPDKFENLRLTRENAVGNTVRTYDDRYEGVKGHPYFSDEWMLGNVLLENEQEYQNVKLKYNLYEDQLVGLQHEKYAILLDKDKVRAFTIRDEESGNTYNFVKAAHLNHSFKKVNGNQFVQVLHQRKVALYAVNRKTLNKASYRGAYNYGNMYDEFVDMDAEYYLGESGKAEKLKFRKRKLLTAFDAHRDLLNKYIDEQQLSINEVDDLLKLIRYYEKLSQ